MSGDEEELRWEIASLRAAISADWVVLASRSAAADPERRKAVREHLDMSNAALRMATEKLEALLNARRGRGIAIDLDRLADEIMPPGKALPTLA